MEIPTKVSEPKSLNPNIMMIFGPPKSGKTTVTSYLEDHLILELESGGADFVRARYVELNKPSEFNTILSEIAKSPTKVCEYLVVDTVTKLDEHSEIVGTYEYMNKAAGKSFNVINNDDGTKVKILHTDKRFETVHSIGQGYGYQHSRTVMTDWYDKLLELITLKKVGKVILIAHIKDKLLEGKSGEVVESLDINLTGKVKNIYASRVDAIASFVRRGKEGYLVFSNDHKIVCGGRCKHLDGEVLISKKLDNGEIETYWDNIFIK